MTLDDQMIPEIDPNQREKNAYLFEVEVSVYSVVQVMFADDSDVAVAAALKYLYGASELAHRIDLPSDIKPTHAALILRTSCQNNVWIKPHDIYHTGIDSEVRALARRAAYLAQVQADRFSSGLYPAKVLGTFDQAKQYIWSLLA